MLLTHQGELPKFLDGICNFGSHLKMCITYVKDFVTYFSYFTISSRICHSFLQNNIYNCEGRKICLYTSFIFLYFWRFHISKSPIPEGLGTSINVIERQLCKILVVSRENSILLLHLKFCLFISFRLVGNYR